VSLLRLRAAVMLQGLIRNQQVVGSNPTGGSRKINARNEFGDHLQSQSIELSEIVRELSEMSRRELALASLSI
jgi:hypothetical protein